MLKNINSILIWGFWGFFVALTCIGTFAILEILMPTPVELDAKQTKCLSATKHQSFCSDGRHFEHRFEMDGYVIVQTGRLKTEEIKDTGEIN